MGVDSMYPPRTVIQVSAYRCPSCEASLGSDVIALVTHRCPRLGTIRLGRSVRAVRNAAAAAAWSMPFDPLASVMEAANVS